MAAHNAYQTFPFTDEHQMLRETLRDLVRDKIAPRARELDETHEFPHTAMNELAELGLLGVYIPEEYGGAGMDFVAYIIAMEELARGCGSTCLTYTAHTGLCLTPLLLLGNEEQKKKYLPALCAGEEIGCFGLTEPSSGSDSASLQTRAWRENGEWVLSGSKMWITNAKQARRMVACAKTDPEQPRGRGITAFIVDMAAPGISIPKVEDKLGLRASSTCQVFLDNVRVAETDVLGVVDTGFPVFMQTLEGGRVAIAAMALGLAEEAFTRALRYSQQRETFGKPLAGHQTIQAYLAEMATDIEAARLLIYQAAFKKAAGLSVAREGAMAKLFASEMAVRVCERAIQIHGGYGYVREFEVERMWRDAKLTTIGEGTSEVQHIVIARQLLGAAQR
jgi:alkylation response protein AidB-like acyl-CoA dehydrogenase